MLLLATLARRWEADLVPNHPIELESAVAMRPRYGLRMILRAHHA